LGRGDAASFSITPEKTKVNVSALFCTFVAKKTQRGMLLILLWGVLKTKFFNQVEKFIDFHTHKDKGENTNIIFPNKKYVFVGDGAINYTDILKENLGENAIIVPRYNSFPRASVLCELSLNREDANIYTVEPEYISKSRAEKNF